MFLFGTVMGERIGGFEMSYLEFIGVDIGLHAIGHQWIEKNEDCVYGKGNYVKQIWSIIDRTP